MARARRVVTDSMLGLELPPVARWSDRVTVVLGLNPGPFTGPGTNTYLIGTGSHRLLLDTGQGRPEYLPLLERALAETGTTGLEAVLVTHAHPDHIGGLDALRSRLGPVPVRKLLPPGAAPPAPPFEPLADGSEVAVEGATLRAVWTPGHAPDHLCFVLREEAALFTGDMVLGAGTTVIPAEGDLAAYLASLERLRGLGARVIYPGHGPAIADPAAKIAAYLAHRRLREAQILEALARGPATAAELVEAIYTDVPAFLHPAAALSVAAHLRKLAAEGRVRPAGARWERLDGGSVTSVRSN